MAINAKVMDMTLPFDFKSDYFDVVYSHFSLHYFTDCQMQDIIKEMNRVLHKDGLVFLRVRSANDWKAKTYSRVDNNRVLDSRGLNMRFFSIKDIIRLFSENFILSSISEK